MTAYLWLISVLQTKEKQSHFRWLVFCKALFPVWSVPFEVHKWMRRIVKNKKRKYSGQLFPAFHHKSIILCVPLYYGILYFWNEINVQILFCVDQFSTLVWKTNLTYICTWITYIYISCIVSCSYVQALHRCINMKVLLFFASSKKLNSEFSGWMQLYFLWRHWTVDSHNHSIPTDWFLSHFFVLAAFFILKWWNPENRPFDSVTGDLWPFLGNEKE